MIQGKSCTSKNLSPVARSMTSQGPVTASHGKEWSVQMIWTGEGKLNSREASVNFPQTPALHGSRINENTSREIYLMKTWHFTEMKTFIKICFKTLCFSSEKPKQVSILCGQKYFLCFPDWVFQCEVGTSQTVTSDQSLTHLVIALTKNRGNL